MKAYHLWGGLGKPRIGIADWITVSTVSEFEVLKDRFTRAGVETVVVDPFRCKPLTVKSLVAVFHEPEMEELLGRSASDFLRTLVPWRL